MAFRGNGNAGTISRCFVGDGAVTETTCSGKKECWRECSSFVRARYNTEEGETCECRNSS